MAENEKPNTDDPNDTKPEESPLWETRGGKKGDEAQGKKIRDEVLEKSPKEIAELDRERFKHKPKEGEA